MIYGIIILVLYFVPAVTAYENKKKNRKSILVINLFLGWTFIGWIVALAMAVGKDTEKQTFEASKSAADELAELFKLKEQGAITEEEFKAHKSKLLK